MLFLNTRPPDRAALLSNILKAAKIEVLELPLLELVEEPYSVMLEGLYQQLPQAHAIVVVSPTAAHVGMRYLAQAGMTLKVLTQIQWIAVGKATQRTLAEYGISSIVPDVETSEGMLELPILTALKPKSTLAFWRGEGGRVFMMDHFRQLGIQVLNFVLYKRQCPNSTLSLFQQYVDRLNQAECFAVLISSEASWLNWLSLVNAYPKIVEKAYYLTLGPRLTRLVSTYQREQGLTLGWVEIENLQKETILHYLDRIQGTS